MSFFSERDAAVRQGERYWCTECGHPCGVKLVDEGQGPVEYEGRRTIHHCVVTISDCCEAEVEYPNGNPVGASELVLDAERDHEWQPEDDQ